jgi:hypothetical protein
MIPFLLASLALADAPLEISVADTRVSEVVLTCGGNTLRAPVKSGVASFASAPSGCTVDLVRRAGTITSAGKWACTADSCAQEDVHHTPISDAPKRVNVVVTTPMPSGTILEVDCPDGSYRERRPLEENTAVFDSVPSEDCILLFKGGVPAKYQPLKYGTFYCSLTGATAVCTRQ